MLVSHVVLLPVLGLVRKRIHCVALPSDTVAAARHKNALPRRRPYRKYRQVATQQQADPCSSIMLNFLQKALGAMAIGESLWQARLRGSCGPFAFTRPSQRVEHPFRRKRLMPYFGFQRLQCIIDSNPDRAHRADQATFPDALGTELGR